MRSIYFSLSKWLPFMIREEIPALLYTTRKVYTRLTLREADACLSPRNHVTHPLLPEKQISYSLHLYKYVPQHGPLALKGAVPFFRCMSHAYPWRPDFLLNVSLSLRFWFLLKKTPFSCSWGPVYLLERLLRTCFPLQDAYFHSRSWLCPRGTCTFRELSPSSEVLMTSKFLLSHRYFSPSFKAFRVSRSRLPPRDASLGPDYSLGFPLS